MMNKKAEVGTGVLVIFGMMIGLMIWIAYTQMVGPATDAAQNARAVTGLDCDNSSISDGTKGTCVVTDFMVFGWSAAIVLMIIGGIGGALLKKSKPNQ